MKHGFLIGGTHSGSGKTTLTLALMAYFKYKNFCVQPFKVGPDFIDPGLHKVVTGAYSRNLDGWMLSEDYNKNLFYWASSGADISIVEGVMGFYDGYDGKSEAGSSAQMAKWLNLPVILVVDAKSMARSVAAVVHGFIDFDEDITWAGVILNRVGSKEHFKYLQEALSSTLPDIPILGWIPSEEKLALPERHLGLVTAEESPLDQGWVEKAISLVESFIDTELILKRTLCPDKPSFSKPPFAFLADLERKPLSQTVAVPMDPAFCFYYKDNLEMLEVSGGHLCFFSPLRGEKIPADAEMIYIGGGYPEVHVRRLAENGDFLRDLRNFARMGKRIYAECGGLMLLSRFIEDGQGRRWPMASIMPFGTKMLSRRRALGYVEVVFAENCFLGNKGMTVRGHEFHYSDISWNDGEEDGVERIYELFRRGKEEMRKEGYRVGSVVASYVHQHWGSNPYIPYRLIQTV